jgi:glyoxylase-like metal-dependent hydrolase (beta-lactamase superfamily II)
MQIIPLSEGSFTIDKSKLFVPFNEVVDVLQDRPAGSLLVEVQPFVVITSKDILLLDTGLGFSNDDGVLQIRQNLINAGVDPEKVTKVLLSHLHKDHSGGVSIEDKNNGMYSISFPNAHYFVQQKELENALKVGSPSYTPNEFRILSTANNVELLHGNGVIDDYITYEITGAHSLYHQVFWIKEDNEIIFFGADDAPQLQQMKHRFIAKYDLDGKKAAGLRQEWWERGESEGWTFLFYHDISQPIHKF